MTFIKASCPCCGDLDLQPHHVRLIICSDPARSYYAFTCRACGDEIHKHANAEVIKLLLSAGVTITPWPIPAEADEPHTGPPITWDDVLDFTHDTDGVDDLAQEAAT